MKKTTKYQLYFSVWTLCVTLLFSSCYKDKGNYDIDMPIAPTIAGLDTLYEAIVGDSLIIRPIITGINSTYLSCDWRIDAPELEEPLRYEGTALKTVFGLSAQRYRAKLTITNNENGMKYFYDFIIRGITEFSRGSLVLSVEDGVTQLSFIKPDNSVQARIYEAINRKPLPENPQNIHYLANQHTGNTPLGYWIVAKNDAIRVDVSTLMDAKDRPNTLKDNFFLAPEVIEVGSLKNHLQGVLMGVINGRFYGGTTSTWDQASTYGMFGSYAAGNYELDSKFVMSNVNGNVSMIAFEKNQKQFLRINNYGSPIYFGTDYAVASETIFNPKKVEMDLVEIVQINNTDTYAYCKDSNGKIYELKFNANFNGPFIITPLHKREFIRQELINEATKMVTTRNGNIYIAAGNKVFQYTPLNESIRELTTSFSSPVTMLKISTDENTLIVGSGSSLFYTNISVGNNGSLNYRIDGIPGQIIDMTWIN